MTDDLPQDTPPPLHNKEMVRAIIDALATTGGADAVCALFVERLRASGDALHNVLADMLDPATRTGIRFKLNLGRKDHPNPARDIEIAARVETLVKNGTTPKKAYHAAAKAFGVGDRRAKELWEEHRERLRRDAEFLSQAEIWRI